ncbi:hypothetical protein [Alteromonas sp. a30]|uniref:hypothetical protein n=1 Tax=Alteromonas sp. a30 TaxID=2730917 RepID=UPI00228272F1|nr:hypothetical protein [Alteromonas sp. a30]MCY7294949.1 hypothetical protein [Alteromonas sp. a30]
MKQQFTIKTPLSIALLCLSFLVIQGCNSTSKASTVRALTTNVNSDTKVLLMPLDVELSVLTAGGLNEVNAKWTKDAKGHMEKAIEFQLSRNNLNILDYQSPTDDINSANVQLEKLHEAVGYNVLVHHFGQSKLPNKKHQFDWTLGEDAKLLKQQTGADYAMFVYVRDSYSSGGRVAMQVGLALLGVGVTGGMQVGFASLVDLNSGDIVWFNQLVSTSGDLRKAHGTQKTVANLLTGLPSPRATSVKGS